MNHKHPAEIMRRAHNLKPNANVKVIDLTPVTRHLNENALQHRYVPEVVHPNRPTWIDNSESIPMLKQLFERQCYDKSEGFTVNDSQYVTPNGENAGIIAAAAMYSDENGKIDYSFANIVNTENAGLRYVHCCESGKLIDLGPVDHACFIGNNERPEGLYIPMHNMKAMYDGADLLSDMIVTAMNKDKEHIKLSNNDIVDSCNGDCSNCKTCGGHK